MKSVDLQSIPTLLIKATDSSIAVINLAIVNYGDTPANFSVYAVPNGKVVPSYDSDGNVVAGNPETSLIIDQVIQPKDTIFLNLEKFLLHPGDALYAKKSSDTDKVCVHVIYEKY